MRELKFRAWAHASRCWIDGLYIGADGDIASYDPSDWSLSQGLQNVTVEQYTGLKDKNGEEIYEGDVVLDYYDGDDTFIVEWDKDVACFRLTGTDNIASVSFDNFDSDIDLEVIGNIHENPELIKEEE